MKFKPWVNRGMPIKYRGKLCKEIKIKKDCQGHCIGGKSCCTSSHPCGSGEGDCDKDHDCKGNLLCGANNCNRRKYPTFNRHSDCCFDPAHECGTGGPCTGGANCKEVDKIMTCVCKWGYRYIYGQCIAETAADECGKERPCTGGADCKEVNKMMTCVCKKGYAHMAGQCVAQTKG